MPNASYEPDTPSKRPRIGWGIGYVAGMLGGGLILPAWMAYQLKYNDSGDGSPIVYALIIPFTIAAGAFFGLKVIALAHFATWTRQWLRKWLHERNAHLSR